jgi:hypothetical protein
LSIKSILADELAVAEIIFNFIRKLIVWVKGIGEPKVGDDDVAVLV